MKVNVLALLAMASCVVAGTAAQAVVTYSLTTLADNVRPGAYTDSIFSNGTPVLFTSNNNVYWQLDASIYKYANGVTTRLANFSNSRGFFRGANADGGYLIDSDFYYSGSQIYPYQRSAQITAVNDRHDIGVSLGNGAYYETTARTANSSTRYNALPGANSPNVEIETINNQGQGAGIIFSSTDPQSRTVNGLFTSKFLPSDLSSRTGAPGQANDGGMHDATQVVQYSPNVGDTVKSLVGVADNGMIAGTLSNAVVGIGGAQYLGSTNRAYVGINGVLSTIGALGASDKDALGVSQANDLNLAGQVVGSSTFGGVLFGGNAHFRANETHGFLYQGGVLSDLNSLLVSSDAAKYTIISAFSINDGGNILVSYDAGNEFSDTFGRDIRFGILAPNSVSDVPEPASWFMVVSGFAAVGFALRRRQSDSIARSATI